MSISRMSRGGDLRPSYSPKTSAADRGEYRQATGPTPEALSCWKMARAPPGRIAQMGQLLNDSLLIFGFLAIVLAPLTLVLDTGPGRAGWKFLTFLCCTLTAWFFFSAQISSSRL